MKKKNVIHKNYLEKKPQRAEGVRWSEDEKGIVTLEIANVGFINKIAQKLFKKPPITYIHLDEMGSFLWTKLNGEENLISLGQKVETHFGDKAKPLYERLAKYIQILDSYNFIMFKDE